MKRVRMNGDGDAGREYAEIWGETVRANRKLRTILIFLSASCVLGVFVLLRIAGAEPPKPIVIRVDDVGRAEALAYEAATAEADPLDPTTKYFLNRFVDDFHSRRRATVEEHWTRSLRFLSTELANAAFSREGDEVAATAAGTAETERQVERVVLRIHPSPEPPHGATADFELVHLAGGQEVLRERWSLSLRFEFLELGPARAGRAQPDGHPHHLPPGRPRARDGRGAMIAHLKGREKALEAFGWTGSQGRVDRAGVPAQRRVHARAVGAVHGRAPRTGPARRPRADRGARSKRGDRARHRRHGPGRPDLRTARSTARSGAEHIRHRRGASTEVLVRRLLSLDYVIEHTDLPWLPTEQEKVAAFEALGIERSLLPVRVYRGAARETRRHFPVKLPVALDSARALFVYADPGHDTATALRSWGRAHRGLWRALAKLDLSVEVVAVARTGRELERARRVIGGWAEPSGRGEPDAGTAEQLARIERAILQGAVHVLEEFGGLQAALKRSVALESQLRRRSGRGSIDRGDAWRSERLARVRYR